ncbi:hypothetical protein ACET3Z_009705 [Daucus carota]
MAGLFDKQAEVYLNARPSYPAEWYSMLADQTLCHSLAWDVGTGNGQAAIAVAEHYGKVIGTDVSEAQLKYATPHPRVQYIQTPLSLSEDEIVSLIGGEDAVDLVTVAQAVHWFDLPKFYSIVTRVLRKPGGLFAVWGYKDIFVSPTFDPVMKRFRDTVHPYWNQNVKYIFDGYQSLPFPFQDVGLGCEGKPLQLEISQEISFQGFIGVLKSWSAVTTAKENGVDLLPEGMVRDFESAWGGSDLVRSVTYTAFMLAGITLE